MEEKKQTGYPHIDRPWMKYYDLDDFTKTNTEQSIYDYMLERTGAHTSKVAMTFYSRKITYKNLFKEIDKASKILTSIGAKDGERILFMMPNVPETAYLMYGASRLGVISDFIDPRPDSIDFNVSSKKVLDIIIEEKANYIVTLDLCYISMVKPIENKLKEYGIKKVIVVSSGDSMDIKSKIEYINELIKKELNKKNERISFLKSIKEKLIIIKNEIEKNKKIYTSTLKMMDTSPLDISLYSEMKYDKRISIKEKEFVKDSVAAIVHTSGTSGNKPKPIPLTNENMNEYVEQTDAAKMPVKAGDKALHMLPYFAAFGLVGVVHGGFCHGNNLVEIPAFDPEEFGRIIIKNKPQIIIGPPSWYLGMLTDSNLKKADLSFVKMITYGGDSMNIVDEIRINEFLKEHNCKVKLTKGHGMSETCGCSSYADKEYNIPGTMGIPMPFSIYGIVNPETKEPINFEDKEEISGELIISTPLLTPGHLDDKEYIETKTIDGHRYILTKDIAIMTKDGVMKFLQRSDRGFMRYDGYKAKPYEIEKIVEANPLVKSCIISPYYSSEKRGNMILASIVLMNGILPSLEEQKGIIEEILNESFIQNPNVSSRQIPTKFSIIDSFPVTQNGKIDYKSFESRELTGSEIDVIIEENNISITNIKVEVPQSNILKLKK